MAADGYVTILRTTDTAQGELLAGTLRSEGIDARFNRVSSALIGVPTLMIEMNLDVPARSEARARELLRDLEYVGASDRAAEQGAAVDPAVPSEQEDVGHAADVDLVEAARDDAERRRAGRSPMLAPGFAFLLPGGAHLYGRRPWTSLVLALGLVLCFVAGFVSGAPGVALATAVALVLGDAIGGVRAARAESRGVKASRRRQVVAGLRLWGVAVLLGGGSQLFIARGREHQLAGYEVSCTGAGITVENQTGAPQVIQLANLKVIAHALGGDESYDIGTIGSGILHLAPGDRGVVKASIADWLDRSCGFGLAAPRPKDTFKSGNTDMAELVEPRPSSCGLTFDFFARDERVAGSRGFEAIGRCAPSSKGAAHDTAGTLVPRR
jgi:hypothetical protein